VNANAVLLFPFFLLFLILRIHENNRKYIMYNTLQSVIKIATFNMFYM